MVLEMASGIFSGYFDYLFFLILIFMSSHAESYFCGDWSI